MADLVTVICEKDGSHRRRQFVKGDIIQLPEWGVIALEANGLVRRIERSRMVNDLPIGAPADMPAGSRMLLKLAEED